jgi:hypothetical protein
MRNHSLSSALVLVSAVALTGCGAEDSNANENVLTIETAMFDVAPGESFECFYTDVITERELSVVSATARQAPGGHHLTVYYVDNVRPVGHAPCSGTAEMVDWHFVVGAGGEGGDLVALADGLALKVPVGKQLMLQTHYINTTAETHHISDEVDIKLTDPSQVKAYAADFVINNDQFEVPPNAPFRSVGTCEMTQDVQLTMLLGHMHELGSHYKLETIDAQGNPLDTVYDEAWYPNYASHPPILTYTMDNPLRFQAGTRFRITCDWNNVHQVPYLFPTEMCIAFGYYFPGNDRVMCDISNVTSGTP